MGKAKTGLGAVGALAASALLLAACGGGGSTSNTAGGGSGEGTKGGTLTFLTQSEQIQHLDPQRNYTGEDLAFAVGYLQRTLTSYTYDKDDKKASELVADMATDTGTAEDSGKTWKFTLRDGLKYQDGSEIKCEDIKYGVSRTFATSVITDGPQYAVSMLDIPKDAEGNSVYKGPYDTSAANDTAAFDKAVSCDGKTITFRLNRPVADFNYTVTLTAFSPVPKAKDTGEKYDDNPIASGPYQITTYTKGQGGQLVLDRNPNWDAKTDGIRKAYPDKIVAKFGLDPTVLNQRFIADAAGDKSAAPLGDTILPESLAQVFNDPKFEKRRFDGYDIYVRYIAINTSKVKNLKHRQAILAAADRATLRTIAGGNFAGDLADSVVKPNIGQDYAPTGLWDTLLGQKIPDNGDPEYAKKLIAESGEPVPPLTYDYAKTPTNDKAAAALQAALAKAGITLKLNPLEPGTYYGIVLDPKKQNELTGAGWGADWPNASTVIPELLTPSGGFPLSRWDDKEFNAKVDEAKAQLDRNAQAKDWQELAKQAMGQAVVLPTRFGKQQRLVGSQVGGAYFWGPYGSWPYGNMWVSQ